MAMMLVTHDLGVVAETADRVVVMYAGRKVEEATVDELFETPLHPYTGGLLGATPIARRRARRALADIPGMVPPLNALPRAAPSRRAAAGDGALPRREARSSPSRRPGRLVACFAAGKDCSMALLSLRDVDVALQHGGGVVRAVTASASMSRGETLGLVGESAAASPRWARRSCGWCR